ncbi:HD domain-containing protein [Desulfobotulus sp. H1]|uniref:HD domain-containing protein n=1 Tax=Desulfobotulus pelophilus TaxID=2823377 RepID=A0ABT3N6X8_9BACT|nr:HD domain-containing protein [Desulfobotulus pelophilus]MCW7753194.1 HD domain-containing protein [Desulfobotulus pelophilus]
MRGVYQKIREMARGIVRTSPEPSFYRECGDVLERSMDFFANDPRVVRIHDAVCMLLAEDWGHGMGHSRKVAVEAGALILMEGKKLGLGSGAAQERMVRLAHYGGLLHDICRKEKDHAEKGAFAAGRLLEEEGVPRRDVQAVCEAIRRHEAFRIYAESLNPEADLLAACLYDADKFRWGPDNFTHTVWAMLEAGRVPLSVFVQRYPEGIAGIARIRETFRSEIGRRFGPEFIDIGMGIAARLYVAILEKYGRE